MAAAVAQVPQIAAEVQNVATRLVQADINASEAQYILRTALVKAALQQSHGKLRPAARFLGLPLGKFTTWLNELHLEQVQKDMRRACVSQLRLSLRAPRRPTSARPVQSFPAPDAQHLQRDKPQ